jgi:hypothetical protein
VPRNPNPRAVWEAAAIAGVSVDDYRKSDAYRKALKDGSVEDPPSTGPSVDSGLVDGDVTVDPGLSGPAPKK